MSLKLIALDLDGTVLDQGVIQKELQRELTELTSRGVLITLNTGRPLVDIRAILAESGITPETGFPHILIANGRDIYFLKQSKYQPWKKWNEEARSKSKKVLEVCQPWMSKWENVFREKGYSFQRMEKEEEEERGFRNFRFSGCEDAREALRYMRGEIEKNRLPLRAGRNGNHVGVGSPEIDKGIVLLKVVRKFKLRPTQILAIGDSQNDEAMLDGRYGFQAATVGNADEEIKRIVARRGGYIAAGKLGEGVIEILKMREDPA